MNPKQSSRILCALVCAALFLIGLTFSAAPVLADEDKPVFLSLRPPGENLPALFRNFQIAGTGTLWENGELDGYGAFASVLNGPNGNWRSADDFVLGPTCTTGYVIDILRTQMVSTGPVPAVTKLAIYADSGTGGPVNALPLYTTNDTGSPTVMGTTLSGYYVYENIFETPSLVLPAGKYWVASMGVADGTYSTYFLSTGNGAHKGEYAYLKDDDAAWVSSDQESVPSDLAFDIDGACNRTPVADAGVDQTVKLHTLVTLNGSGSADPDGHEPLTYQWTQTNGPVVTLSHATAASPTFTAPAGPTMLIFRLTVTDSLGAASDAPDEVVITVEKYDYDVYLPQVLRP
jgi:hypothetical protein